MRSGPLADFFPKPAMSLRRLLRDESGGVLVEATLIAGLLIVLVLGSVDWLFAFYRWNAAGKAVQLGARIAAVSDPVATGLNGLSADVVCTGDPTLPCDMPSFTVTCLGNATSCTCTGFCTGIGASPALDQNALNTIVYGRGSNPPQCGGGGGIYFAGMCSMSPGLTPANVVVVYTHTAPGIGYAPRAGGPVPTVQVSLQQVNFQFSFLPFGPIPVRPSSAIPTTVTGEVLSSVAQCSWGPC
jgi:Flp pilus assembly pilin Flp